MAADSFDLQTGEASAAGAAEEEAPAASAAGAFALLAALGKSVVQRSLTACMPAQHGTETTPYAVTLLPLSTHAGLVPSHLHMASGQLDGSALQFLSHHEWSTCMAKGDKIGGFGGGWLEHPRQWLGAQWAGLFLRVPSCPEPLGASRGGTGAKMGHCQGGHFDHAAVRWYIDITHARLQPYVS